MTCLLCCPCFVVTVFVSFDYVERSFSGTKSSDELLFYAGDGGVE